MNTAWVYVRSEPGLYTVGFYGPDGEWNTDSDHPTKEQAASRVIRLNGSEQEGYPGIAHDLETMRTERAELIAALREHQVIDERKLKATERQREQIAVLREAISDMLLAQSSSAHKQCDDGLIALLPSAIRKARAALAATEDK